MSFTVDVEAKLPKDANTVQDFLVNDRDQRKKLDNVFYICYFDLKQSVLTSSVPLSDRTDSGVRVNSTENFGEIYFEAANNAFGIYVTYIQIDLRVYFNFLKCHAAFCIFR